MFLLDMQQLAPIYMSAIVSVFTLLLCVTLFGFMCLHTHFFFYISSDLVCVASCNSMCVLVM